MGLEFQGLEAVQEMGADLRVERITENLLVNLGKRTSKASVDLEAVTAHHRGQRIGQLLELDTHTVITMIHLTIFMTQHRHRRHRDVIILDH